MKKIYNINCDSDYIKAYFSALKKVFSVTLFPRVLISENYNNLTKKLKKYAYFECFCVKNSQLFAKKVHNGYFDIGLYFYKKDKKTYLKIYDGTGHIASSFVINIFDKIFAMDSADFEIEKSEIIKRYNSLNKNKLLKQIV